MFNIDKYLSCLELKRGPASLELLNNLISKHLNKYSFNNLKVYYGSGTELSLDLDHIFVTSILNGEGGYCFELNKLFHYLLEGLGFDVKSVLARVHYNKEGDFARTHRFLIVTFDNVNYLCDVGFGAYCPSQAIPLTGEIIKYNEREFRVTKEGDRFNLEVLRDNNYFSLYHFDLLSIFNEKDFDVSNYFTSTHSSSKFVNELVVSRIGADTVEYINNNKFGRFTHNTREEVEIKNQDEFQHYLKRFNIVEQFEFDDLKTNT